MARAKDAPKDKRTKYDRHEIVPKVFEEMAKGRSLRSICSEPGMPKESTVRDWCDSEEYIAQYARAREKQAHSWAESIIDLADTATPEDYQVVRLQVDARKWTASKILPKVYGDRQEIEHSGKLENIVVNVSTKLPPKK